MGCRPAVQQARYGIKPICMHLNVHVLYNWAHAAAVGLDCCRMSPVGKHTYQMMQLWLQLCLCCRPDPSRAVQGCKSICWH